MKKQRLMDSEKQLYVPEDIITNILKRLPVKSLIRFQCVCEEWNNLIKSQSFITHHLHRSSSQNPFLILESNLHLHVLDSSLKLRELQKPPIFESFGDFNVVGSCNGLLLLENLKSLQMYPPLFVSNPATQEVVRVPSSTMLEGSFDRYWCMTGFGFSPIVNDYVILRIYRERGGYNQVVLGEVFSLSRGSWKEVDVGGLKGVMIWPVSESVTVDGFIAWTGVEIEGDYDKLIVLFDIVNEVFTLIPTSDLPCGSYFLNTISENKVALLCVIWGVDRLGELWVLDGVSCASGMTWRWTKRCNISHLPVTFGSWTVWRNNIVGVNYREEILYLRDLLTSKVKMFDITYHIRFTGCYVESLVSVGNYYNGEASS